MTEKFLKAKHWQLFLLTFGIPMVFQIVIMVYIFSNFIGNSEHDSLVILNYIKFFPVMTILLVGILFSWLWAIAIGLQSKLPENVKMKVKKFKTFFFIPLIYIILITIFLGVSMGGIIQNEKSPNLVLIGSLTAFIIPLHLFSMFCIFYLLYFVAKTYKTVELQREVHFSDFAGEFFMIWFYPIGIWIIQPKVNKMIED